MRKKVIGVAVALVLAIIGTVLLTTYVQDAEDRALEGQELVEVFVVNGRIDAGTPGDEIADRVTSEKVPAKVRPDDAVVELNELRGRVASTDLVDGEQLLRSRFIAVNDFERDRSDLVAVPDGFHEVTFSLEPERAVGGKLKPGDTVSFVASFEPFEVGGSNALQLVKGDGTSTVSTEGLGAEDFLVQFPGGFVLAPGDSSPSLTSMLLHKMVVTAVQVEQEVGSGDGDTELAPTGNLLITLAGDSHQVERMIFSKEFGRVWLSYEPAAATEDDASTTFPMVLFQDAQAYERGELDSPPPVDVDVLTGEDGS